MTTVGVIYGILLDILISHNATTAQLIDFKQLSSIFVVALWRCGIA